jgi:hypothetical protein
LPNWHDAGRFPLPKQPVPYKHNESRRHKFSKPKYKVTNWPEYNAALRRRGDITIWFTEEAIDGSKQGCEDDHCCTQTMPWSMP